jgi:hypothetical protein
VRPSVTILLGLSLILAILGIVVQAYRSWLLGSALLALFCSFFSEVLFNVLRPRRTLARFSNRPESLGNLLLDSGEIMIGDSWSFAKAQSFPLARGIYHATVYLSSDGTNEIISRLTLRGAHEVSGQADNICFSIPVDTGFISIADSYFVRYDLDPKELERRIQAMMEGIGVTTWQAWLLLSHQGTNRGLVFIPSDGDGIYEGKVFVNEEHRQEVLIECPYSP